MDDVGHPVQGAGLRADPGRDAREQTEAQVVVEPVAPLGAEVGIAGAVEIVAVIEQQQRRAVGCQSPRAGRV
jgi:hypothetical protein